MISSPGTKSGLYRLGIVGADNRAEAISARFAPDSPFAPGALLPSAWSPSPAGTDLSRVAQHAEAVGARLAPDWADLLAPGASDAVLVLAPVHERAEVVEAALSVGKPVMCPIPIASSAEELDRISAAVEKSGNTSTLFTPGSLRFTLAGLGAIEQVGAGHLGTLHTIYVGIRTRQQPGELPAASGPSLEDHLYEALDFVLACTTQNLLRARMACGKLFGKSPDTYLFNLRFDDDVIVTGEVSASLAPSFPGPDPEMDIDIAGTLGALRVEPNKHSVNVWGSGHPRYTSWLNDPAVNELERFTTLLKEPPRSSSDTLDHARRLLKAVMALRRSCREGEAVSL